MSEEKRIYLDGERSVAALWTPPEAPGDTVLVYAPGAGSWPLSCRRAALAAYGFNSLIPRPNDVLRTHRRFLRQPGMPPCRTLISSAAGSSPPADRWEAALPRRL